jgi:hypothetical protein
MTANLQARPVSENNTYKKKPPARPQSYNKSNFRNIQANIAFSTDKSR